MSPVPLVSALIAVWRDLGAAAGDVPDPRLVEDAGEEAALGAAPVEVSEVPRAACWMLVGLGLEVAAEGERAVEDAVEVQPPGAGGRVVDGGGVVPDVAGDDGRAR